VVSRLTVDQPQVFTRTFVVPEEAIDELGHVSNLKYNAWMQEIAIEHSAAQGWPVERYLQSGAVGLHRSTKRAASANPGRIAHRFRRSINLGLGSHPKI
jgi:hypothetical protein